MGMFDYLSCEYPLPEGAPVNGWQTKDTPAQYMETYRITRDGFLFDENGVALPDYHGDLWFSHSNVTSRGPNGYMTQDGQPYRTWRFVARFTDGRLTRLEGGLVPPTGIFQGSPISPKEFYRKE